PARAESTQGTRGTTRQRISTAGLGRKAAGRTSAQQSASAVRPTIKAAVSTLLLGSLLLALTPPASTKTKPKPQPKHRLSWAIGPARWSAPRPPRPVGPPRKRTKAHLPPYIRKTTTQTAAVVTRHSAIRVKRRKAETRALRRERAVLAQLRKVSRDL